MFNLTQLVSMMSIGTLMAYSIVAACVLLLRFEVDRVNDGDEPIPEKLAPPFSIGHLWNSQNLKAPTVQSSKLVTLAVTMYCKYFRKFIQF